MPAGSQVKASTNGSDPAWAMWVPVNIHPVEPLVVDEDYQRGITHIARDIELDFKPEQFEALHVNVRPSGKRTYCVDGANRRLALINLGITHAPCFEHRLSKQAEADLAFHLNRDRKKMTRYQQFRARLASRDAMALDILRIVEETGHTFESAPDSGPVLSAVGTVELIYEGRLFGAPDVPGPEQLQLALSAIKAAWPTNPDGYRSGILQGIARLYARNVNIRTERFVRVLASEDPWEMNAEAGRRGRMSAAGKDRARNIAAIMAEAYSKGQGGEALKP